jgi:hypothetical protein
VNNDRVPTQAIIAADLGAIAILISPITPWTMTVVIFGLALLLPAAAVMIPWLLRRKG